MPQVNGDSTNAAPGVLGQNTGGGVGVADETTGASPATGVRGVNDDGVGTPSPLSAVTPAHAGAVPRRAR
jgi:hypothetical protein